MKRVASAAWAAFRAEYADIGMRPKLSQRLMEEAEKSVTYAEIAALHESIVAERAKCSMLGLSFEDHLRKRYGDEAKLTDLVDHWWRPQKAGTIFLAFPTVWSVWTSHMLCELDLPVFGFWLTTSSVMAAAVLAAQRFERVYNFKEFAKKKHALDQLAKLNKDNGTFAKQ